MDSGETPSGGDPVTPSFAQTIRSDELRQVASVLGRLGPFKDYVSLFQVDVILDANIVLRDLMWLSRKRKNPQARPEVLELMDCATVRAHAPTFLIQEIELKIPVIAKKHRIAESTLREHWERYRIRITFVDVGGPPEGTHIRDPKDIPYLRVQERLKYPIASHDHDLAAMGGQMLRIEVFSDLKTYSRNTSVEYHMKFAGMGSVVALVELVSLIFRSTKSLSIQVGKLPRPVVWLAIVLIIVALVHPTSRKWIFEILERVFGIVTAALEGGFTLMQPLVSEHYAAKQNAASSLARAKEALLPNSANSGQNHG